MTQISNIIARRPMSLIAENQSVTVPATGRVVLLEAVVQQVEKVSFQIDNTVQALDEFVVMGRVHPDAAYQTFASVAGDFSSPSGRILSASGALVTLAAGASGRFDMDTSGLHSVRIEASAAVNSAVASIYASGSGSGQSNTNVTLLGSETVTQAASTMPAATTMQNASTGNANGVSLNVAGYATAIININANAAMSGGTIVNFEASVDDSEWSAIMAHQIGIIGNQILTTSANGDFRINCAGFKSLRARISAYSAGTVTVKGYASVLTGVSTTVSVSSAASVTGTGYVAQATFNRTADTANYSAGDIVGTGTGAAGGVTTFSNIGPAGGDIVITDVDLMINNTTVPSGMTSFRMHLYNATPPSALGDNAAWDLPSGDQASYLGYVDLGTPVDVGSSLFVQTSGVNKKIRMGATANLFGYIVTNGAYQPASGTTYYPRLNAVQV